MQITEPKNSTHMVRPSGFHALYKALGHEQADAQVLYFAGEFDHFVDVIFRVCRYRNRINIQSQHSKRIAIYIRCEHCAFVVGERRSAADQNQNRYQRVSATTN